MGKIIKSDLLAAMKKILQEYENKTHNLNKKDCPLCKLYYKNEDEKFCEFCPMNIFSKDILVGCLDRKCRPVDCSHPFFEREIHKLLAVTKFYALAVQKVEIMEESDMNCTNAFNFLFEIDKEVAEEYMLNTNDN
jgi:hypothetical protein